MYIFIYLFIYLFGKLLEGSKSVKEIKVVRLIKLAKAQNSPSCQFDVLYIFIHIYIERKRVSCLYLCVYVCVCMNIYINILRFLDRFTNPYHEPYVTQGQLFSSSIPVALRRIKSPFCLAI